MTGEKQVLVVPEDKFYQATGMYYEEWHPLYLANSSGKELEGKEAEDFKKGMVFVKEQLSQVTALQDLVLKKENKIGDLKDEHKKMRDAVAYKDLEITRREMEVEHSKAGLKKEREKLQNSDVSKLEDKLKATEQELQDAHKEAVEELNVVKDAYCRKVKNTVALQRIKYEKEICRIKKESLDLENKLIGLLGTNEPLYKLIGEIQVNPEDIKARPQSDEDKFCIQIVKSDNLKMATLPQNSKVLFYVDADDTDPFIARGRLECGFVYFSLSDLVTDESETDKAALVNLMLKDVAEGRKSAHVIPYSAETIVNILEKRISETKMPETEAVKLLKAKATAAENELINLKKGSAAMMKYMNALSEKKYEETVKELKETYEARIGELEQKLDTTNATDAIEIQRHFVPLFLKWQDAEGAEKQKLEDDVISFFKEYGNNIPRQISNLSHMFEAYCPQDHLLSGRHLDLSSGTIIADFRYLIKKCESTALQQVDSPRLYEPELTELCNKGIFLEDEGKYQDALLVYDKLIRLAPDFLPAYLGKIHALKTAGSYQDALGLVGYVENNLSQNLNLGNYCFWEYKGDILTKLGKPDEAQKAYETAKSLKEELRQVYAKSEESKQTKVSDKEKK
jgi:tetratricopeptide (TPR) repeat protein